MLNVGLTGNAAAGKSTVARLWASWGVPVVSADELARRATAPGSSGLAEVREAFGDEVVAVDGSLDRAALRARVFSDEAARRRLEEILHPRIRALRAAWLEERRAAGERLVISEIPLLFETGADRDVAVTVVVHAPDEERLRRLVEERGLDPEEAGRLMASQMDADEKHARADVVIGNPRGLEGLDASAWMVLGGLRRRAGVRTMRLDLHLHTAGSWDCLSDPRRVLERARARGLDRIAITDHDRLDVALEMARAFPGEVIPGEEVRTGEGIDVIGLYLREEIPRGTPAREVVERIHAQGGIAYLPHPYARGKGGGGRWAEELAPLVDVVETFNARLHPARLNEPARDLARRHGRPAAAGSDAHTLGEVGRAAVEVVAPADEPRALLAALAHGRVVGRTAPHHVHLASTWAKLRKRLPGAPNPLGDPTG